MAGHSYIMAGNVLCQAVVSKPARLVYMNIYLGCSKLLHLFFILVDKVLLLSKFLVTRIVVV